MVSAEDSCGHNPRPKHPRVAPSPFCLTGPRCGPPCGACPGRGTEDRGIEGYATAPAGLTAPTRLPLADVRERAGRQPKGSGADGGGPGRVLCATVAASATPPPRTTARAAARGGKLGSRGTPPLPPLPKHIVGCRHGMRVVALGSGALTQTPTHTPLPWLKGTCVAAQTTLVAWAVRDLPSTHMHSMRDGYPSYCQR